MEKRTPQYPLDSVQRLVKQGDYRITRSARSSAIHDFGLTEDIQIAACVLVLTPGDFYKSMTSLHDAHLWQDVYHLHIRDIHAYVKIQIVSETTVVISFKDL